MPQHALEKIIAQAAGRDSVSAGEIVNVKVDFAEINDLYLQTVYSFREMGGDKVWDKDRVAFVFDHYAPCPTIDSARNHKEMREFAIENGLTYHFDTNCGVCHQHRNLDTIFTFYQIPLVPHFFILRCSC